MPKFKKKQNSDRILILSAILLLTLSINVIFWSSVAKNQNNINVSRVLPIKIIGNAKLTVDFGNGDKRVFEGSIIKNETLIDVLNQAARAGDFSYKLNKESGVASIGKLAGDGKKSWYWYINGKKVNQSIGEITVKSNDSVLIKYERS